MFKCFKSDGNLRKTNLYSRAFDFILRKSIRANIYIYTQGISSDISMREGNYRIYYHKEDYDRLV